MPELPEVETVRLGLADALHDRPVVSRVQLMREDIRFPIPKSLPSRMQGQPILGVRRFAKYLLIDMPQVILLSHLGMTGSWRIGKRNAALEKHDHCFVEFEDGRTLVFRDPRRFGILDLVEPGHEREHPRLRNLGVEPLDQAAFTGEHLFSVSRKRHVASKVFLMDQRIVVGIGNIYASETFFRALVRPSRPAGKLTRDECVRIVSCAREILQAAIKAGGSSIRDYRQASGEQGGFQDAHTVYDRAGQPCVTCGAKIMSRIISGRSTFWCGTCQD